MQIDASLYLERKIMLTYQLRDRTFLLDSGAELSFPNNIKIELTLEPARAFGGVAGANRIIIPGNAASCVFDGDTGHVFFTPDPPLPILQVTLERAGFKFSLEGNIAHLEGYCDSESDFLNLLSAFHYTLPALFTLALAEPPIVIKTQGRVGDSVFRWIFKGARGSFTPLTKESAEARLAKAYEQLFLVHGLHNRRLAASINYFHTACRLLAAGRTRWEFMSEAILNFSKSLEVLFGSTRDEIRSSLEELGYSSEDIEGIFIPITILRDEFDVAHESLSMLSREQLEVLHQLSDDAEGAFKSLLKLVLEKAESGNYGVKEFIDSGLDRKKKNTLDRLFNNLSRRLEKRKPIISKDAVSDLGGTMKISSAGEG